MKISNIDELNESFDGLNEKVDEIKSNMGKKKGLPIWVIILITALTSGFLATVVIKGGEVYINNKNLQAEKKMVVLNSINDSEEDFYSKMAMSAIIIDEPELKTKLENLKKEFGETLQSGQNILFGQVLDKKDGFPIPGAVVQLEGRKSSDVITNKNGGFFLPVPESMWNSIIVVIKGNQINENRISIDTPPESKMVNVILKVEYQ